MAINLKILRLLNGDVLGEVLEDNKEHVKLKNPVRVVVLPSKSDPKNPTVGFAPFCEWSDDIEVTINRSFIVATMTPIVEFVNQYNASFGGIVVPDSKIIKP